MAIIRILLVAVLMLPVAATAEVDYDLRDALSELMWRSKALEQTAVYPAPNVTVVEFFNQNLQHYFRTGEIAEIAAVENGAAGPGWIRTGEDFPAWSTRLDLSMQPVCRFYAPGPNSHFYTIVAAECAAVKLDPGWHYEGNSFYAIVPPLSGSCPGGTSPIYRSYNARFAQNDSNHRFAVKLSVYQEMTARGWTAEGVVMCVSALSDANTQKTARLIGGTWVISYTYGVSYTDRLTFTSLYTAPSTGVVYAQGTNHRGVFILGGYDPTLDRWGMISPFSNLSTYPFDWYVVSLTGNSMTGCYWFVVSSISNVTQCNTQLTGFR